MCLFTDGLFEGRSGTGMFGRARLDRVVRELGPDASANAVVERVVHDTDAIRDDIAVCIIRVERGAAGASTVRVEELEVDAAEVGRPRVRRFLQACGVEPGEIDSILNAARAQSAQDGSVILRVRMAADRSGVDLVRPLPENSGAPVALLRAGNG
jgi:hypothetical protein